MNEKYLTYEEMYMKMVQIVLADSAYMYTFLYN